MASSVIQVQGPQILDVSRAPGSCALAASPQWNAEDISSGPEMSMYMWEDYQHTDSLTSPWPRTTPAGTADRTVRTGHARRAAEPENSLRIMWPTPA
jgi:hypothetical protein